MYPSAQARRRRAALVTAGLLAAAAGVVVGAGVGDEDGGGAGATADAAVPLAGVPVRSAPRLSSSAPVDRDLALVRRMSLGEQVGQTLILAFSGTTPPFYVRRAMREGRAGGVVLFRQNVADPGQLRRLTASLQKSAGGDALICADQEGGEIRIVRFASPEAPPPGQRTIAAASTASAQAARDLRSFGVNVNLAPVADVLVTGVMRGRTYPGGPASVGRLVAAAVKGAAGRGVASTVKHFPGLGAATRNTDFGVSRVPSSQRAIYARDLPPFRAAIRAGVPIVMSSHALYPALSPRRIASQSPHVMKTILRRQLGFRGVLMTDSMEAKAVLARSSVETASVRAMLAGNDSILMTGRGSYRRVRLRFLAEARRSPAFRKRIIAAATRVVALKRGLGRKVGA